MRYSASLVVTLIAASLIRPAHAQEKTPQELARITAIKNQIEELRKSQPLKEYFELKEKSQKIRDENERKSFESTDPLETRAAEIERTDAFKQYEEKTNALEAKAPEAWKKDRDDMIAAAKALYSARHDELRKLAQPAVPQGQALGFDLLSYPRIDGSSSTQPLAVIMASRLFNIPYEWQYGEPTGSVMSPRGQFEPASFLPGMYIWGQNELRIAGSRVVAVGKSQRDSRIAANINSLFAANTGTHEAYENLINNECDINLTARPPSPDELALAREKKVELDLVPIAKDAFVFIVHRKNPVRSLSLDQLRQIYLGKIQDWKTVGGTGEIIPLMREPNSGSRELFDVLIMKGTPFKETPRNHEFYAYTMSGPYSVITEKTEAIAYSVFYYEHFMALSPYTRTLAIDGIEPTSDTIASGKYPLVAPVYAAFRKSDPEDSAARRLLKWLLSPEGQAVVKESGYIPAK